MNRPDPDALLRRVQAEDPQMRRARLKVFFGMAPGVGKTYAMLAEARDRLAAGVDVVAGVVETHGRTDTQALLDGLHVLAGRAICTNFRYVAAYRVQRHVVVALTSSSRRS